MYNGADESAIGAGPGKDIMDSAWDQVEAREILACAHKAYGGTGSTDAPLFPPKSADVNKLAEMRCEHLSLIASSKHATTPFFGAGSW